MRTNKIAILLALLFATALSCEGAIAVTSKASAGDTTNTTAYASGSFTPAANSLLIASFAATNASSTNPSLPTCAGGPLTWVQIADNGYLATGTNRGRQTIFAALVGGSPGAMTATATYSAGITGCAHNVYEVTGSDASNGVAQTIVQAVNTTAGATGTSLSITLAAAGNAANRPFLFVVHGNEAYTFETGNGWAIIGTLAGYTSPSTGAASAWKSNGFDTSVTASWATSLNYGGVAFEIKALVVSGVTMFRNRYGSRARFMQ